MSEIDQSTCWYQDNCPPAMNQAYLNYKFSGDKLMHIEVLKELIAATDEPEGSVIDIGCGTALSSEYLLHGMTYNGCDLPHILTGCAMLHHPEHFYRVCDIVNEQFPWIKQYKIAIVNGVIDVMQEPLAILGKILYHGPEYIILHRQEITVEGKTHVVKKPSYNGETFHSIINREDFLTLLHKLNYTIVKQLPCGFADWEDDGTSFLLRKCKSWALSEIDYKLSYLYDRHYEGIFIEAGANDGLRQSNTMFLEFYKNWTGVLIEPVPELARAARENRSQKTVVVNAALVAPDFGDTAVEMIYTPDNYGLLSCVDDANAPELLKRIGKEKKEKIIVPGCTLDEIIGAFLPGKKIDILILDVEGYEYNALRGLSLDKHFIGMILIENLKYSGDIYDHLVNQGYSLISKLSEHDYLYRKNIHYADSLRNTEK